MVTSPLNPLWDGTGAEEAVLLCCARTRIDTEISERMVLLLQRGVQWDRFLRLAQWNSLLPLVYRNLNATCAELVPSEILGRLRMSFHASSRHNLVLTQELLRLLDRFHECGIPAVPFKGPVLAADAYGNLALRQFDDLDILLDDDRVPSQMAVLTSLGYQPEYPVPVDAFQRLRQGLSFVRHDRQITVDVHWGIELHWSFTPHLFSQSQYRRLWDRLQPISLAGRDVMTLSPEDSLLLLSVHGAKHRWGSLRWICDVAEIVRRHEDLDWDALVETSTALRGRRMLFLALFLARDALGAPVPEYVMRQVRADGVVHILAAQVPADMFSDNRPDAETIVVLEPFHLQAMDTLRDKIRYCLQIVLTPTVEDWMQLPLPRRLFPLYYVMRPFRLAGKYGRRIARRGPEDVRPTRA